MGRKATQGLTELRRRVASWRRKGGGGRGNRIPDELWDDAVGVARVEGLHATSKALRFNYERLRDRVEGAGAGQRAGCETKIGVVRATERTEVSGIEASAGKSADSRFVTVQMGELGGGGRTVLDLTGRHGDRMRLELPGGVDVVGLVERFWSRGP